MAEEVFSNEIEKHCIHGQDSPCSCACPFPLNVREFLAKIKKGSFHAAFNMYREAVSFPELVWRICPAPCGRACQKALEQPVNMPMLEQAAVAYARSTDPINYNLPEKPEKIAVVGSGLSGLSCARRLAVMNYKVTVFEQKEEICTSLEKLLPRNIFEPAIQKQFQFTSCQFKTGEAVSDTSELEFDAVYFSSGVDLKEDSLRAFSSPADLSPVEELVEGVRVADAIEWFLKTGNHKPLQKAASDRERVTETPAVSYSEKQEGYAKGEARQEAERCTLCDCSACMQECVLMRHYGQTPQDLERDAGIALNVFPELQARAGMREIGGCNFCGLCKKICPSQVDIGAFLLKTRTELCSRGVLPKAHHEFWMRDMDFSNGKQASVFYQPEETSDYMFFPGCQAGGSDSRYVTMTYEKLLAQNPRTALLLRCCGAPALWAGEAEIFKEEHGKIREFWKKAGCPVMLVTCPSCYRIFKDYMPEIPVKTVYEILDITEQSSSVKEAAVFDPCSSRDYPDMQNAVRSLVEKSGVILEELKYAKELAQCCSFGGHGYKVNPLVVQTQAKEQAELSSLPYITYCTNCRDIFSARGKNCRHILDLINGINDDYRKPPTATERRNNRKALKKALLAAYPVGEEPMEETAMITLVMEEKVAARMSDDLILEEDLAQAIEVCEKKRNYLVNTENDHRVCHLKIGYITYWVEYLMNEDGSCTVYKAYSHRMAIKGEYTGE